LDSKGEEVVYTASTNPTQSHLFRRSVTDLFSEPEPLSKEPGLHSAVFNYDHKVFVRTSSLLGAMPRSTVHGADGKLLGELPSVAEEPPETPLVELTEVGERPLITGTAKFHAAIVRPRKFDEKKRYPVLVDVYGGPHFKHVVAAMNRWLLNQWYADQ